MGSGAGQTGIVVIAALPIGPKSLVLPVVTADTLAALPGRRALL